MRRINKKLVEALDKLIAKYSGEGIKDSGATGCPLCQLYLENCDKCINSHFGKNGCADRYEFYPMLYWRDYKNYPILKQFWTDYKTLYLQRIYTNSEIMEILIKPFKEEKK